MNADLEEFNRRITIINERLQYISERTAQMARTGKAHSENQDFIDIMDAQDRLIKAADTLIENILKK
ncbi:MAG: hypothetical protein KDI54_18715 [Gammaproteobacteria bacterium]|nr:hypothetical protein [Gammaproteobacteria bacterium]